MWLLYNFHEKRAADLPGGPLTEYPNKIAARILNHTDVSQTAFLSNLLRTQLSKIVSKYSCTQTVRPWNMTRCWHVYYLAVLRCNFLSTFWSFVVRKSWNFNQYSKKPARSVRYSEFRCFLRGEECSRRNSRSRAFIIYVYVYPAASACNIRVTRV